MSTDTPGRGPGTATTDDGSVGNAGYLREEVAFVSGGQRCEGWFYRPSTQGPHACVVMGHGFGGIRAARLDAFAERFAQAGLAAMAFDYRHCGGSAGEPRGLIDIGRQRADYRAAIAYVRAARGVDPQRVAMWGTSFSGGHVLTIAAEDDRIAAAVLTNPYVDGPAALRKGRSAGRRVARALARRAVADGLARLLGAEPRRITMVGPPGSVAMWTTPDAQPGYASILPPDQAEWQPTVPARVLLQIATDRPTRHLHALRCPLLVSVCDHDQIAPVGPAVRVAQRAPQGELRRYRLQHFDVFTGDGFEQIVTDQAAFLREALSER